MAEKAANKVKKPPADEPQDGDQLEATITVELYPSEASALAEKFPLQSGNPSEWNANIGHRQRGRAKLERALGRDPADQTTTE